jgi:hypothetical protein
MHQIKYILLCKKHARYVRQKKGKHLNSVVRNLWDCYFVTEMEMTIARLISSYLCI